MFHAPELIARLQREHSYSARTNYEGTWQNEQGMMQTGPMPEPRPQPHQHTNQNNTWHVDFLPDFVPETAAPTAQTAPAVVRRLLFGDGENTTQQRIITTQIGLATLGQRRMPLRAPVRVIVPPPRRFPVLPQHSAHVVNPTQLTRRRPMPNDAVDLEQETHESEYDVLSQYGMHMLSVEQIRAIGAANMRQCVERWGPYGAP